MVSTVIGAVWGIALAVLLNLTANKLPDRWAVPLLRWGWLGVCLYFTGLIMMTEFVQQKLRMVSSPTFLSYVAVAFIGALLAVAYWALINSAAARALLVEEKRPATPVEETQKPDVALHFVHPEAPALMIVNSSNAIARDIKWAVALWNADLPDRNDPLPIPVSTFDWIKPHDEGGPQNLFSTPTVAPLLKLGNRLIGTASVSCPECPRGRTYLVYVIWGSGGWFSEVEDEQSGKLILPGNFLKEGRERYFKHIETVPAESRIPIGGLGQNSLPSASAPRQAEPVDKADPVSSAITVVFLIREHQLQIHNRGTTEFALWGDKMANDGKPIIEKEPRMVAPGAYWYIEFQEVEQRIAALQLKPKTEATVPFYIFVADALHRKFTIKCFIRAVIDTTGITYHTANLGTRKGWVEAGWIE